MSIFLCPLLIKYKNKFLRLNKVKTKKLKKVYGVIVIIKYLHSLNLKVSIIL